MSGIPETDGLGDGEADGEGDGDGEAEGDGEGDGDGDEPTRLICVATILSKRHAPLPMMSTLLPATMAAWFGMKTVLPLYAT